MDMFTSAETPVYLPTAITSAFKQMDVKLSLGYLGIIKMSTDSQI